MVKTFQETITGDELQLLPPVEFTGPITVVDTPDQVDEACNYLLGHTAIGFDTETRPSFSAGKSNKVALLQLSSSERCFLFRLSRMRLDKAVIKTLEHPGIVKVGVAVRDDVRALQHLRHFKPGGFVDLQSIVGNYGIRELGLRKMAAIVLGARISKAQRLSNWEASTLTLPQQIYAATDAWISLEIYKRLLL
ncbi:MAG: 3'-5' exonuclease domain-containing protein 2 [Rikenellaceae bacterium]|jgi:ribonuclease D|nr:3'-5' exonuclease domain-containing protein 2 [Rikenellaceae bacterium]